MKESVNELIMSVFKSYRNGEPITPHVEANIKTVKRMLRADNSIVYCKNTDCIYQRDNKCKISTLKTRECLGIDEYGQCLSFSDNENDLD